MLTAQQSLQSSILSIARASAEEVKTQLGKIVSGFVSRVIEAVGWEGKGFNSNEAASFGKESSCQ